MLDPLKEDEKTFLRKKYKSLGIEDPEAVKRLLLLKTYIII